MRCSLTTNSPQPPQTSLFTRVVHFRRHRRFLLDQFPELRRRDRERYGGRGEIEFRGGDHVECFGQQCGEIIVLGVDVDPPADSARLPERSWLVVRNVGNGAAEFDGQADSQAERGLAEVLGLAAALVGLGVDAGGAMPQHDGRFDFIAVLSAGTAATEPPLVALGQQFFGRQRGGVWGGHFGIGAPSHR